MKPRTFLFLLAGWLLAGSNLYACGGSEKGCGCLKAIPAEYQHAAPTACPGSCGCHLEEPTQAPAQTVPLPR